MGYRAWICTNTRYALCTQSVVVGRRSSHRCPFRRFPLPFGRAPAPAGEALMAAAPGGAPADGGILAEAAEVDDLLQLARIAEGGQKRTFEQRSWAHAKHARTSKALRKTQGALEQAEGQLAAAEKKLNVVACTDMALARAIGLQPHRRFDITRALSVMRQAVAPTVHRDHNARRFQNCSSYLVCHAIEAAQRRIVGQICAGVDDDIMLAPAGSRSMCALSWMWDETSQAMRKFMLQRLQGEAAHSGKSSAQVMMQRGVLATSSSSASGAFFGSVLGGFCARRKAGQRDNIAPAQGLRNGNSAFVGRGWHASGRWADGFCEWAGGRVGGTGRALSEQGVPRECLLRHMGAIPPCLRWEHVCA